MKHETYAEYDEHADALAERALLTLWAALGDYHDDLVLVGGLVPRYLCGRHTIGRSLPAVRTIDVDLGIALGASAGQYGSLRETLSGQGFLESKTEPSRFEKVVEHRRLVVDFLTENPGYTSAVRVDDIPANVMPGINRALASPRKVPVEGEDLYGARQKMTLRVCEVGPFLVLKLRAFAGRQGPKDAFDLLYTMLYYDGGTDAAVAAFATERELGNLGFADAVRCLQDHFHDEHSPAPVRASHHLFGEATPHDSEDIRFRRSLIRQDAVNVGRKLLDAAIGIE